MDCKKSYFLLNTGVLGGAAIVFMGLGIGVKSAALGNPIALLGLLAMLGGIGQAFLFYKCPNCGRRLNVRGRKPEHCPNCGRKLDL